MSFLTGARVPNAHSDSIWGVAWSKFGLLTGSLDETVLLWNAGEISRESTAGAAAPIRTFAGHSLAVCSVAVSPDGVLGASSSMDGSITVYDLEQQAQLRKITLGPTKNWTVAMSNKVVATGATDGAISMFTARSGEPVESSMKLSTAFALSVAFNESGDRLAAGGNKGELGIMDPGTGQLVQKMTGHSKGIRCIQFAGADGQTLLTGSEDQTIGIYDVRGGQQVASLAGHNSWVTGVAFPRGPVSAGGVERFASCSCDRSVKIWELRTQEPLHCFDQAHSDLVTGIAFGPAGTNQLVTVSDDASIQFYTVPSH